MKKLFVILLIILSFTFYVKADNKSNLNAISKTHKINTLYLNKMLVNKNLLNLQINKVDVRNYKNNFTFKYSDFELNKKYSTPLNHLTLIKYYLPSKTHVELNLYNLLGNKLKTLVSTTKNSGEYYLKFDTNKLIPGLYIYQLKTNLGTRTQKMIYLK
ncbi:MAG: T9SS type A sorting domain-containing protein [Bacteroidetes bacterium]|nr:T9SS type A sorting domain-containing protein [Bacteroidota bacterium]MCH8326791.1 T9SS type A sorting domain-containing protein [Bacteroidota bacterium]